MSFLRNTVLIGALLLAGRAGAADVNMAGGSVSFHTPDNWVGIMETQGDPEVHVYQVPDPSPTAGSTLARVTVTVKQAADLADFQQYMSGAMAKARSLDGYQPAAGRAQPNGQAYTAKEAGAPFSYSERYWFVHNHAVQLRCVRPSQSQAGAAWTAAFDKGCDAVAASLQR